MTKQEYADYEARVKRGLAGLEHVSTGACPGCEECGLAPKTCPACNGDGQQFEHNHEGKDCPICQGEGTIECTERERELAEEPSFSWSSCDCCGSSLGGNRHPAHGWLKSESRGDLLVHLSICADCLYYINYGQLDDMTMMEMGE